jgi:penicillin-binding protein activator
MLSKFLVVVSLALALTAVGCATSPVRVDTTNDRSGTVMGLDYRDFAEAAGTMVQSILESGAVNKPEGGRYVLVVSRIKNDTMQRIDTDQLVKKIRVDLLRSGKVVVTTAMGADGAEDAMSYQARELRGNDEFAQERVAGKGQMIAPDLSLSGKIIQRNNKVDRRNTQVDYYFQMTLTDINTGLAFWEDEVPIIKRGSSKSVTW